MIATASTPASRSTGILSARCFDVPVDDGTRNMDPMTSACLLSLRAHVITVTQPTQAIIIYLSDKKFDMAIQAWRNANEWKPTHSGAPVAKQGSSIWGNYKCNRLKGSNALLRGDYDSFVKCVVINISITQD